MAKDPLLSIFGIFSCRTKESDFIISSIKVFICYNEDYFAQRGILHLLMRKSRFYKLKFAETYQLKVSTRRKTYQWLPAEFNVSKDGQVTFEPYIYNLHPTENKD